MEALQIYWWLVIAVLAGALVFLLFVQGGQTMLLSTMSDNERTVVVNALGRKWELTFTTLVVFGGAFFASFPLFYSTSFGGAYWLWMLILFSFIIQAVSFEFRRKPGNLFGTRAYDTFLFINGCVGCVLLGVAVGTMFFGGEFTVQKTNILSASRPVISQWAPTHGLEAIWSWKNLLLGFTILFLARMLGAMFMLKSVDAGDAFARRMHRTAVVNGVIFVALFLGLAATLFLSDGYEATADGSFVAVAHKYLLNLVELWWIGIALALGVVMVLYALLRTILRPDWRGAFWWAGVGTVVAIVSLFCALGYNDTAYMPSLVDPASSLSIANSSSTEFTLKVMAWVTVLLPVVIAYIAYVWSKMTAPAISASELDGDDHKY